MTNAFGFASMLLCLFALAPVASAQAHLRVPADNHVILLSESDDGTCCAAGQCFRYVHFPKRLLPNGQTEDFSVPHGKVLVVTDVEWTWSSSNNSFPNRRQLLRLLLGPMTSNDVAKSSAITDFNSFAADSLALTSGFTVAHDTPVCGFFGFGNSPFLANVTLGGYLDVAHK